MTLGVQKSFFIVSYLDYISIESFGCNIRSNLDLTVTHSSNRKFNESLKRQVLD